MKIDITTKEELSKKIRRLQTSLDKIDVVLNKVDELIKKEK